MQSKLNELAKLTKENEQIAKNYKESIAEKTTKERARINNIPRSSFPKDRDVLIFIMKKSFL